MGFEDDLLEGLDDFEDEALGDDFDEFPEDLGEGGGPSPVFLIAGGLIVATFLVLLVIVILLIGSEGDDESAVEATNIAATNEAVRAIFIASATRQADLDATATATTERFFQQSTQIAVGSATAEIATVEAQLNASRTALAVNATATEEEIVRNIASTADAQTATAIALTPTATFTPIPPTIQIDVRDQSGNPIPGGVPVYIYLDDGDGVFDPIVPPEPSPTPRASLTPQPTPVTPTNTAQPIFTQVPSPTTVTEGTDSDIGIEDGEGEGVPPEGFALTEEPIDDVPAAGLNLDNSSRIVPVRFVPNNRASNPAQGGGTPAITATPADGDRQIATIFSNPDGSFTLQGLPPGDYWIVLNGETIGITIPDEPTVLEIPVDGQPVSILVIPNVTFPTITPMPTATQPPTATLLPEEINATATAAAQQTLVASIMPTFQTAEPTIDPAVASVVAGTLTAEFQGTPGFTPPATIDETGFFEDLAEDATPGGLTFLAAMGALLIAAIIVIRRLRAAL